MNTLDLKLTPEGLLSSTKTTTDALAPPPFPGRCPPPGAPRLPTLRQGADFRSWFASCHLFLPLWLMHCAWKPSLGASPKLPSPLPTPNMSLHRLPLVFASLHLVVSPCGCSRCSDGSSKCRPGVRAHHLWARVVGYKGRSTTSKHLCPRRPSEGRRTPLSENPCLCLSVSLNRFNWNRFWAFLAVEPIFPSTTSEALVDSLDRLPSFVLPTTTGWSPSRFVTLHGKCYHAGTLSGTSRVRLLVVANPPHKGEGGGEGVGLASVLVWFSWWVQSLATEKRPTGQELTCWDRSSQAGQFINEWRNEYLR